MHLCFCFLGVAYFPVNGRDVTALVLDFCKNHSPKDNPFLTHSVTFQKTNISQQAAIVKFSKPTKRKELAFSFPAWYVLLWFASDLPCFYDDLPCFTVSPPTSKGLQPSGFFKIGGTKASTCCSKLPDVPEGLFPHFLSTSQMMNISISRKRFSKGTGVQSPQDAKSFWSRLFGLWFVVNVSM